MCGGVIGVGGDAHNLANAKTCSALSSASEWLLIGADKAKAIGVRYSQRSKGNAEALTEWGGTRAARPHTQEGHRGTQRVARAYLSPLLGGSTRAALWFVGHTRAIEQEERAGNREIMKAH